MTRADIMAGLLALLLAGVLAVRIGAALEAEPARDSAARATLPSAESPSAAGFTPPPLSDFDAVLARPLFVPGRRPAVVPAAVTLPASDLRLVGVVTVRGRPSAVLRAADGRTVTAGAGEGGEGWSVVAVDAGRAVVERDGIRHELALATRPRAPATVTAAQPLPAGDPGPGDPDPGDPGGPRKNGRP